MLEYLVVAGPNGAGKSTLSASISRPGAIIFDPDIQKSLIEKQYPDISDEAIETALTGKYNDFELRAIAGHQHLTIETNLRNDFLAGRAEFFAKHGYKSKLVFMLLPDVRSSMDRVNLRVKQKGHFVDAESIRFNFEKSLENFRQVAGRFDELMLVCAAAGYGIISPPELLLTIKSGEVSQLNPGIPAWAQPIVNEIAGLSSGRGRAR